MSINRNIAANAVGNAWIALVQVAFIPVYIDLLGVEAFGLIGVYGVLQMAIVLLDMGLTPTMNREVALARAGARGAVPIRNLLRSLEVVLLGVAVAILLLAVWLAPWIADRWLRIEHLEASTAVDALRIMAAIIAVRVFIGVHRGVVTGSQDFVWLNATSATFATLRGAGVVPVLWWLPTIEAFFAQQLAVTVVEAAVVWRRAWTLLPAPKAASFSTDELRGVRRFTGGMALLNSLALVLSQADKVVSSALLPLAEFGYYALAGSVASALGLLLAPVGSVAFPRLTALVARPADEALTEAFHELAQLSAVAVAPAALVLGLLSYEALFLWTGEATTSSRAAPLLAVLAVGTMLNCFLHLPCLLPMARGRTAVPAALSALLAAAFIPGLWLGVSLHGAIAAAYGWLGLNAFALALAAAIPQLGLPWRERWRWLVFDTAAPACAALAGVVVVKILLGGTGPADRPGAACVIALSAAIAFAGAAVATQAGRRRLRLSARSLTARQK